MGLGSKMGLDATRKWPAESVSDKPNPSNTFASLTEQDIAVLKNSIHK
ncbi:hypothetical protein ACT691_11150 [Vibrio metschnikovii]